ncbi:Qat anti-phage system TatD family nuclease QatD [Sphingobacterium anhuiense]|uniref:Qat anti-phage system TatD family nuclease QatD n=1 Tax=Sphingobacterium anhuiense TaxID=493780 RepID=A0ABW5YTR5_9SPHI
MNEFLFDTHAHLDLLPNFEETVSKIEQRKIYTIAVTNLPSLYRRLNSRVNSKYIKPALGFHPELIEQFAKHIPEMWDSLPQAKYIGEVGIDLKNAKKSEDLQISFFTELINRCDKLGGKIITVHSRGAAQQVVDIIGSNFHGKFILHWYSGGIKVLEQAVSNGAYFSINYAMTLSSSGQRIIQSVPKDRLLLESDAPFVNVNGKCYDSLCVDQTVAKIAELKNITYSELLSQLNKNFKVLLG